MEKSYKKEILPSIFATIFCGIFVLFSIIISKYGTQWIISKSTINSIAQDCSYESYNDYYIINPVCIKQKELPDMTLVAIINEIWDQIEDFSGYYQPFEQSFNYFGATPIFKTVGNKYLEWDEESLQLVDQAIKKWENIQISRKELAQYYAEHLSYFVADKDLTELWNCTRQNYLIALESLDWLIMNPWDIFDANTKLISLQWYCKWASSTGYLFYWWVCGMTSQLFRVSLLNPNITINKRFPHSERFVQYYGDIVWWDDAAVYEKSKIFEIQNSGDSDIIFKTRHKDNRSIMVAISWPIDEWVNITKNFINEKETAVHLEKTIYQPLKSNNEYEWSDVIINIESFDSYYSKKTYQFR